MLRGNLICGIGRNDTDYKPTGCPFYSRWYSMLSRCYNKNTQQRQPSYKGCEVVREWHTFSVFRAWMAAQPWEGNQLDKDLLVPGNKLYGPDTCVFVSHAVNSFLTDSAATKSRWSTGVHRTVKNGAFAVTCSNPFAPPHTIKNEYLGAFATLEEAIEVRRAKKHEHACRFADMQTDPRIAHALRTRFSEE